MSDTTHEPAAAPPPPPQRGGGGRVLLVLSVVALFLFVGAAGVLWWAVSRVDMGKVEEGTFLHVQLEGLVPDAPAQPSLFDDPSTFPPTATEIARAIRRASEDDRIDGVYLEIDGVGGGWAVYQELRDALAELRDAGKPCVAYTPSMWSTGSYYLASVCDEVGMSPGGLTLVNGIAIELTYYKGLLEKLGAEPEFEHVGDFKSFIEIYERTSPSESAAEAYEALLDSLYDQMLAGIADGRDMTVDEVSALVDDPTLVPELAVEQGLVDLLAWPDAMKLRVHRVGDDAWPTLLDEAVDDDEKPQLTSLTEYLKAQRAGERKGAKRIAVVHAAGSIVTGDDEPSMFGGDSNLTDGEFASWMRKVRADDSVAAVVLRVDSPGGSALAASHMWREIERTKQAGKPVVVSMANYAASGGYLISAPADWIVAQPGTLTGSIGVFGGKFDLSGTWGKLGMTMHTFERGAMADLLSLNHGFDDAERAAFKEFLAAFYDEFLDYVVEGRDMTRDEVHAVAQGRVWTGVQALDHGLVDELGGLDVAIAKAKELAEIEGDVGLRTLPAQKTFFEMLVEDMDRSTTVQVELPFQLDERAREELEVLEDVSRHGGVAAWLPGLRYR